MGNQDRAMRKLSFEFSRDVYVDASKSGLLTSKWILQGMMLWPDRFNKFITIFHWFWFFNLIALETFHVTYVYVHRADIADMADTTATVTTTFEAIIRLFTLITKKQDLNDIIYIIWKHFWSSDILPQKKASSVKLKIKLTVMMTSGFLLGAVVTCAQMDAVPFLNRGLVLKATFPFEWNQPHIYEAVYFWEYIMNWSIVFVVNSFDFLFVALVINCAMQYVVVQHVMRNISTEEGDRHKQIIFAGETEHVDEMTLLLKCVDQHRILIDICRRLEAAFTIIVLSLFFTSISAICVSFFVMKVDESQFYKMLTYAMAHLLQLFYYCYVGNELTYESADLSLAIFESNWEGSQNKCIWRSLINMIQRAQRIPKLTAAGLTELNFTSFLMVIRLSFSFYTLLDSLMEKRTTQVHRG